LDASLAKAFGLRAGTPVSSAIIDAHAAVPGAGAAEPGTMVMVMGTSACHMLNSRTERHIPGVAGVVEDGILPGFFGYETGQAAVGDAFAWLGKLTGTKQLAQLGRDALALPPGAEGVRCIDWFNGCRTPLLNADLRGAFLGLGLNHRPVHLYRGLVEATACGARWIIDELARGGVAVENLIATGGLPHHMPGMIQVFADVLGRPIMVHPSQNGSALGAAILGGLASGAFASPSEAVGAMSVPPPGAAQTFVPVDGHRRVYDRVYDEYRQACETLGQLDAPSGHR
jgi:L-ribulokinase